MTVSLQEIVNSFLADEAYLNEHRTAAARRLEIQPALREVVWDFIENRVSLSLFCERLQSLTRQDENIWFIKGNFMVELSKLNKNHNDSQSDVEGTLRNILVDLNARTLGQSIEQFYQFLLKERERLRRAGKPSNAAVAPANSAVIISLFTAWLDPTDDTTIYTRYMRDGLYLLYKSHILSNPLDTRFVGTTIEVNTRAEHEAFQATLHDLLTYEPQIKISPFWSHSFLCWVCDHLRSLVEPESLPVKDIDESSILDAIPAQPRTVREGKAAYTLTQPHTGPLTNSPSDPTDQQIDHKPLQPTPEPLLTRLIREVQRSILVNAAIIRRIYHALLAGHVILTGPPGTGKTELARIIPETLWRSTASDQDGETAERDFITRTAYTTRMVTGTDDWSVRTLISGITPQIKDGTVAYKVQNGHLTSAIMKNWALPDDNPDANQQSFKRTLVTSSSGIERGTPQQFRGLWLVIDEFNRAPIDLALGDALTALGGHDVLRVAIEGGSAVLPIPQDFRIIGTLNSFDRSYLNQISEALKRRFSFVEILPPDRAQRAAEQGIVLYKALKKISHLSDTIVVEDETITWGDGISIELESEGSYSITWLDEQHPFRTAFEAAWRIFEIIRIYRQLGTAQAISLVRSLLITGIMQDYDTPAAWIEQALDAALCDTIADQLQVLLPDEVEVLFLYLASEHADFAERYNRLLATLVDRKQRLYGQLLSLNSVSDETGRAYLSDEEVERLANADQPEITSKVLTGLFYLDQAHYRLPQFTKRLRTFKAERGL